jgi:hypothetical protein
VVSHLYRDDKLSPPLTGAYLSIPVCIAPEFVPAKYKDVYLSREQNENAPILHKENMNFFNSEPALPFPFMPIPRSFGHKTSRISIVLSCRLQRNRGDLGEFPDN